MAVRDKCDVGSRVLILLGYVMGLVGVWWGGHGAGVRIYIG